MQPAMETTNKETRGAVRNGTGRKSNGKLRLAGKEAGQTTLRIPPAEGLERGAGRKTLTNEREHTKGDEQARNRGNNSRENHAPRKRREMKGKTKRAPPKQHANKTVHLLLHEEPENIRASSDEQRFCSSKSRQTNGASIKAGTTGTAEENPQFLCRVHRSVSAKCLATYCSPSIVFMGKPEDTARRRRCR